MLEPGQEGAYVSLHHCLVQVCGALAGIGCVALGSRGGEDNLQPSEQGRGMFEKVVLAAGEAASGGQGAGGSVSLRADNQRPLTGSACPSVGPGRYLYGDSTCGRVCPDL